MEDIQFNLPKNKSNIIKVIGVGGGGSNAVNHMFEQGIKGVDYVICNTDAQALASSKVPCKIQLGSALTEGLGAGSNPEVGKKAAQESIDELRAMLETRTKMVFITAGMGGGTGTGAAPIIAQISKEMGILTVGIVTIPFSYEGKKRGEQAREGVEKLRENVDSLIVINNNKLSEIYGDLGFKQGYAKADEVLSTAAKGIAEVISKHYIQNIDLEDARTVLASGGTAIMGAALASGEGRARKAIEGALNSPLLNDNKIVGARNVLLLIVFGEEEITQAEVREINEYIQNEAGHEAEIIMGVGEDLELGEHISVTVIATGFRPDQQDRIVNIETKRVIYSLDQEQTMVQDLTPKSSSVVELKLEEDTLDFIDKISSEVSEQTQAEDTVQQPEWFSLEVKCEPVLPVVEKKEVFELATQEVEVIPQYPSGLSRFSKMQPMTAKVVQPQLDFGFSSEEKEELSPKKVLTLSEYQQGEATLMQRKPESAVKPSGKKTKIIREDSVEETLSWEVKKEEGSLNNVMASLSQTAEQRKKTMKEMNYRFGQQNSSPIQDLEIPAYQRQGVELSPIPDYQITSRETLNFDTNGEIQIRKNNSFLHDNVD